MPCCIVASTAIDDFAQLVKMYRHFGSILSAHCTSEVPIRFPETFPLIASFTRIDAPE